MSTKVVSAPRSSKGALIARMADKSGIEPNRFMATIRETVMPTGRNTSPATDEQIAAFLSVADNLDLDPFKREIFAFPAKGGGIVPVVPVDGWVTIINRHSKHNGVSFTDELDDRGNLIAVTCHIRRKDRDFPIETTEYMIECKRDTDVWRQWPRRMLRHKALIQCARIAYGLSGALDQDEAERMGAVLDLTPSNVQEPPSPDQGRPALVARQAPQDAQDAPDQDEAPAEGEVDQPEDTALARFKSEIARAKTPKALHAIWNAWADQMPEDDTPFAQAFAAREQELGG